MNIVDLIGQDVRLTKRGKEWVGLCPFHAEKTPSFSVSEGKGLFFCFSCSKGGDSISYLRQKRGMSFRDAARMVGRDTDSRYLHSSAHVAQAETDILQNFYVWEHAQLRKWTDAHRALLADQEEAEIGERATRRCPELYTEEEKEQWAWRLVEVNLALEESAFVPTMADIFTYDEHRQERFLMWEKEITSLDKPS